MYLLYWARDKPRGADGGGGAGLGGGVGPESRPGARPRRGPAWARGGGWGRGGRRRRGRRRSGLGAWLPRTRPGVAAAPAGLGAPRRRTGRWTAGGAPRGRERSGAERSGKPAAGAARAAVDGGGGRGLREKT